MALQRHWHKMVIAGCVAAASVAHPMEPTAQEPVSITVLPGDAPWTPFTPAGTVAEISARYPRDGLGSVELVRAITSASSFTYTLPGQATIGTYGQLSALSYQWYIDPSSESPLPPMLMLRIYEFGDPRSFFLSWTGCTPTACNTQPLGSWQTTSDMSQLTIGRGEGGTQPATLADIPSDAPITGINLTASFAFGRAWSGAVDNVTIGFGGQTPTRYNFEVTSPSAMRQRPTITWPTPPPVAIGTPLSALQLNATADVPGTFTYTPVSGSVLPADVQLIGATFVPSDTAAYQPISKMVTQIVAGVRRVLPGDPGWFQFEPNGATASVTGTNPRGGNGSIELMKSLGGGSAILREPFPQTNRQPGQPAFGTVGQLSALSFDWLIDPASSTALPPVLALRVYDFGDPRSFFLFWDTCSQAAGCLPRPTGSWESTDLIGHLSIQAADGNVPPASLADIDPNAPIIGVHVKASFSNGQPWHGFADNVAIGFGGNAAIVYNFEIENGAPVANNDSYTANMNTALNVAAPGLLANDDDADGDPLTAVLGSGPFNGSLVLNSNGSFTYTPALNFSGNDSFTYRASDGITPSAEARVSLTVTRPFVSLSTSALAFGNQNVGNTSAPQTITVSNSGNGPLVISGISMTGVNASDFGQTNDCGSALAAGATCTIGVTFTPTNTGTRTAAVSIADNDPSSSPTVGLTGTGRPGQIQLAPSTVAFGPQLLGTTSAVQRIAVKNAGTTPFSISTIDASGDFGVVGSTCGATLAAGATCSVNVAFAPTAEGSRAGVLTVTTGAGAGTASLTGMGTIVGLSPAELDFGNQAVGTSSAWISLVLRNVSSTTTVNVSPPALTGNASGDYAVRTSCGSTLSPSSSCTIEIQFTPTKKGARKASVTVAHDSAGGALLASLTGHGR
jgi:hypothetical protein